MKYFEISFSNEMNMCGRGTRVPTIEEATKFYHGDIEGYAEGGNIIRVTELNKNVAMDSYDFDNESSWPVFE